MAFKILLTENKSALGARVAKLLDDQELAVTCPDVERSTWLSSEWVDSIVNEVSPALVINTLELTVRDYSEFNPALSTALAAVASPKNIPIVHASSHLVFSLLQIEDDGLSESVEPAPDSEIGNGLYRAEQQILRNPKSIILRCPWIVDSNDGVLGALCEKLVQGELSVSDECRGSLVAVDDFARAIVAIVLQVLCNSDNWGVFHMRSSDTCSEAELADYISRMLVKEGITVGQIQIVPIAERFIHSNGWLVGTRCADCFGIQYANWRQGIKTKIQQWLDSEAGRRLTLERSS